MAQTPSSTTADTVRALQDPQAYREAAEREQAHWGEVLADPDRKVRARADAEAATALGMHRDHLPRRQLLRQYATSLDRCLSLGCGEGRVERALLKNGIGRRFDGLDISEK